MVPNPVMSTSKILTNQRIEKPIFIVGHSRSGSTLLASILGRHQEIIALPETHFFGSSYAGFFLRRFLARLSNEKLFQRTLAENIRLQDVNFDAEWVKKSVIKKAQIDEKAVLDAVFLDCIRQSGKSRILEKTPYHLEHVELILKWYPDARIICILRDGRDAIDSLLSVSWTHSDPQRHAAYWSWCVAQAKQLQRRHSGAFSIIRYEDLLKYPDQTISHLCDHVGVSFDSRMLQTSGGEIVPQWEKRWKHQSQQAIDQSNLFKWKNNTQQRHKIWTYWMKTELDTLCYDTGVAEKAWIKLRYRRPVFKLTYAIWRRYRTHVSARKNKFRRQAS